MPVELVGSNLVVAASHFNPSVFSQLWLLRNGILGEEEFRAGCLFSDQAVNVESEKFSLLVIPPQLQFVPKVPSEVQGNLVATRVGAIVQSLPHTPYLAVGLNFFWHVKPADGNVAALTRTLFFDPARRLCRFFESDDARFGAYFSKDTLGCRLKLDIKPVIIQAEGESREQVQFAFNFHLDLPQEEVVATLLGHLRNWDAASAEATRIVTQAIG